jgi:DUF971 family protein
MRHPFAFEVPGRVCPGTPLRRTTLRDEMTTAATTPAPVRPTELVVHQASRVLEVAFDGGERFRIPFELLRVYSPSAEVQGHGPGQEVLQTGKRHVLIVAVEPVGHYAIKPIFSDGHESGIYSWSYLHELGCGLDAHWARYLERLQQAGVDRDAPMGAAAASACGHHG